MKLFIDNYYTYTYSTIPAEHKVIWDRLKYFNENFEHVNRQTGGSWDGWSSMYNVRVSQGFFYTGFLDLILLDLQNLGCNIELEDRRIIPDKTIFVENLNYELRDYQERTIKEILAQPRGSIDAAMSAGKTPISLDIFINLGVKTLILVHRKSLMYQNYAEYKKFAPDASVGRIGDGKFEIGEDFTVGIINSVSGRIKRKPETIIPFLKSLGCIICDESHVGVNKQFQSVLELSDAYYRYGQSGTLNLRNQQANIESIGLYGPIRTITTAEELVKKGHSAQVYYKQIDIGFPESLRSVRSKAEATERGIKYNKYRNGMIVNTAFKFLSNGYSPVILFRNIDHGEMISEELKGKYPHVRFSIMDGTTPINIREKIKEDYISGKIDIIISSMIMSTGISINKIDCVIFAGGGTDISSLLQIGGRAARKKEDRAYAYFIDFADNFHPALQEDSLKRKNGIENYPGYEILE